MPSKPPSSEDSTLDSGTSALDSARPDRIGPYRTIQVLGEGGMGVVYEAEQTEPVRRRVAVKIIKLGMDSSQVVARFEAERQALAVMDHPYIAKVLGGGATENGRPYFVMELVRGVPLPDYCDRNRLSTKERLELFLKLCQAIQHAHQKGVIHRDLKPSNILVSPDGDTPVPRVIDFGIAKAMGQPLTDRAVVTLHGQAIGTPAYMSPEQAGALGLDVDTRTDIYSLGVILYELLVGALPVDPTELGVPEFLVRLARLETDPPTPSSRLATLVARESGAAKKPATETAALRRQLKGDLDWIIMKAIEKNRSRRYPTVNDLAEDIRRFLAHETVSARPPTTTYRLSRFVRRNRAWVTAASIALAAILFGAIGASVGLVRATRAEAEAQREAATDTDAGAYRKTTLREAQKVVEKLRSRRVHEARKAVANLLDLYDAPENTIEHQAVFVGPRAAAWGIERRRRFHETLRSVLHHLENDPALTSPLGKRLEAKPRSRRGPERILREQYKLARDPARDLLAALRPPK